MGIVPTHHISRQQLFSSWLQIRTQQYLLRLLKHMQRQRMQ
jgi:hypothetical protein